MLALRLPSTWPFDNRHRWKHSTGLLISNETYHYPLATVGPQNMDSRPWGLLGVYTYYGDSRYQIIVRPPSRAVVA